VGKWWANGGQNFELVGQNHKSSRANGGQKRAKVGQNFELFPRFFIGHVNQIMASKPAWRRTEPYFFN
jgi:hypothetical protein